jgi:hypothetical protein
MQIYCIRSSRQLTRGHLPAWELGVKLITPHVKKAILLRNVKQGLRLQWILSINDLSYRKLT